MKNKTKDIIQKKIAENPEMTMKQIAAELKMSYDTMLRRMKKYGVKHNRKPGVKKGTEILKLP